MRREKKETKGIYSIAPPKGSNGGESKVYREAEVSIFIRDNKKK